MNSKEIECIFPFCNVKKYKKGELIFREREEVNKLYFVVDGFTALFRNNYNLDQKVIFVFGKNEILNEVIIQEEIASSSCMALSDVEVLVIQKEKFVEIMKNNFELSKAIIDSISLKLRRCYRQLGNTPNAMKLDKQVASKLWKLGRDFGRVQAEGVVKIGFELSITFLADMVGAKRETVSRVIKKLTQDKLITVKKNCFYILNMEELQKYAAE